MSDLATHVDFVRRSLADAGLPPAARLVLVALVLTFRNATTGRCTPSFTSLASAAGLSERAAKAAVACLQEAGLVTVERGNGGRPGRGHFNSYTIHFGSDERVQDLHASDVERVHETPPFDSKKGARKGGLSSSEKGAGSAHEQLKEQGGGLTPPVPPAYAGARAGRAPLPREPWPAR